MMGRERSEKWGIQVLYKTDVTQNGDEFNTSASLSLLAATDFSKKKKNQSDDSDMQ